MRFAFLIILLVFSSSILIAQKQSKKDTVASPRKIMEVNNVTIELNKKNPSELIVKAKGEVNVGGWTKGKLKPRFSLSKPPANGIFVFDFIATPPDPSISVVQVVSPISASYIFKTIPENFKKAIVYSENNKVEKKYN